MSSANNDGSDADSKALLAFARGLAGGASVPRSKYLFDAINLPQVRWLLHIGPGGTAAACAAAR